MPDDANDEPPCTIDDSALEALRWGLPHRARDRAAWAESTLLARLRNEPNPVRRIALALAMPEGTLSRTAFSALVGDAWAAQDVAGRYLLARRLLPVLANKFSETVFQPDTADKRPGHSRKSAIR